MTLNEYRLLFLYKGVACVFRADRAPSAFARRLATAVLAPGHYHDPAKDELGLMQDAAHSELPADVSLLKTLNARASPYAEANEVIARISKMSKQS